MDDDFPCLPPIEAEVGDQWICPECARKFSYVLVTLEEYDKVFEAWYTDEVGF